ncbi:MBL fold metallo-hydrolase [Gordonia hydrophobica]|uniref:MBL fold metallo-hydrolase n=1 Tax=Gordonia hydrophobica TaxID=40516 RepID=A0ABZ2U4W8_9ACTN|nr:MBL fold metallo-hydrolase [Gordonia hydrophobica]MBM7368243.1 glyoxylase-like metal-dependent hydrolase (beta-lactamase superfamily II) [Gordonia hydrophobica]
MTDLTLDVYTSPLVDLPNGGQFSPTTSTLVLGPTEALLVDTQYLPEHVDEVRRRIEASGRTLTTIFITHAHSDHYFGLELLLDAFPTARAVATRAVAEHAAAGIDADRAFSKEFFAGAAVDNTVVPHALETDQLTVDGTPIHVVDLPQADIHPTAALHIPSIGAVIAGDAIYNGVNPFLAASGPAEWPAWLQSVQIIADLNPKVVVAGHKKPELADRPEAIEETKAYLEAFISGVEELPDSRALVPHMHGLFPDFENGSALLASAVTAYKHKKAAQTQ